MRILLLLPSMTLAARNAEQVGMMQVKASTELVSLGSDSGANSMLQTVRELAQKGEKPSAETKSALQTIQGLVSQVLGYLVTEKSSLQDRADKSTSAILACDASWGTAEGHRATAEGTTNSAKSAHSDCRKEESNDLADQTDKCNAMDQFHAMLHGQVCDAPDPFDRDNSETYMTCINTFWTTYASDNKAKIDACEAAETEYTRQHGECDLKQGTFEEAACSQYTSHAAMCTAYGECRPPAVQDFEDKKAAIGLEETSIKSQYKVLKTVECYVTTMLGDDTDSTADALSCDGQEYATSDYDIDYPDQPAAKPCTVVSRPCESDWTAGAYAGLPSDAPQGECAACPAYTPVCRECAPDSSEAGPDCQCYPENSRKGYSVHRAEPKNNQPTEAACAARCKELGSSYMSYIRMFGEDAKDIAANHPGNCMCQIAGQEWANVISDNTHEGTSYVTDEPCVTGWCTLDFTNYP